MLCWSVRETQFQTYNGDGFSGKAKSACEAHVFASAACWPQTHNILGTEKHHQHNFLRVGQKNMTIMSVCTSMIYWWVNSNWVWWAKRSISRLHLDKTKITSRCWLQGDLFYTENIYPVFSLHLAFWMNWPWLPARPLKQSKHGADVGAYMTACLRCCSTTLNLSCSEITHITPNNNSCSLLINY